MAVSKNNTARNAKRPLLNVKREQNCEVPIRASVLALS